MTRWPRQAALVLIAVQVCGTAALYVRQHVVLDTLKWPFAIALGLATGILALHGLESPVTAVLRRGHRRRAGLFVLSYAVLALSAVLTVTALVSAFTAIPQRAGRSVVLLTINDVYRIEGLDGIGRGGLARVATLRRELEAKHPGRVLLLHAGDVLFPSFLSKAFDGAQMIDVLNALDGDATPRVDDRFYVAFGNHEFERESCDGVYGPVLQDRVRESQFVWLHSNVVFTPCADGRLRVAGANMRESAIVSLGEVRVGLFSLTIETPGNGFTFKPSIDVARQLSAALRRDGADIVVAVTHLTVDEDRRVLETLGADGPDLIVGGHEHTAMAVPPSNPRIFKADADAATAWILELTRERGQAVSIKSAQRTLDETVPPDPIVAARVTGWIRSHEIGFCKIAAAPTSRCLAAPVGATTTDLDGEETAIRTQETALGNWIADEMLAAFKRCRPDAAIINSGSLRLNQRLPASTTIVRRHIEELVQYRTALHEYTLDGDQIRQIATISIAQPGSGGWLQMSGLSVLYDPGSRTVSKLRINGQDEAGSIDLLRVPKTQAFRVVTSEFVATGTDGFTPAFRGAKPLDCERDGVDLKQVLFDALAREKTIAPTTHGRICTTDEVRRRECLAAAEP